MVTAQYISFGRRLLGLIGFALVAAGLWAYESYQIADWKETEGRVQNVRTVDRSQTGVHEGKKRISTIEFSDGSKTRKLRFRRAPLHDLLLVDELEQGAKVFVAYDPDDPSRAVVDGLFEKYPAASLVSVLVGLYSIIMLAMMATGRV